MNKELYECYSYPLMKFLFLRGVEPFKTTQHYTTKNTMWVYEMDDKMDRLLKVWTKRKEDRNK